MCFRLVVFFVLALFSNGAAGMTPEESKTFLETRGVTPTAENLRNFFKQALLSESELQQQVIALGDADFNVRKRAVERLSRSPLLPRPALDAAIEEGDPETAFNARKVLDTFETDGLNVLLAALVLVPELQIQGLSRELISVLDVLDPNIHLATWEAAFNATLSDADRPVLIEALQDKNALVRWAATSALHDTAGSDAADDIRPVLNDVHEGVRLLAAGYLIEWGDRAGLPTLIELLRSKQMQIRQESNDLLTSVTGKDFGFSEEGTAPEQEEALTQWRVWLAREGNTTRLTPRDTLDIDLIQGRDLGDWVVNDNGKMVTPDGLWSLQDGVIACTEKANGYLRTRRAFKNYELTLEWRWPAKPKDGGIFIMMGQLDAMKPECLEVQLHHQRAGDFWQLGGFPHHAQGHINAPYTRKLGDSSERAPGEWNGMTIRVHNGTVRVDVNGVRQNEATGTPVRAAPIGLQAEGTPIEFRNIRVKPGRSPFLKAE